MKIKKRNGEFQAFMPNKILSRIKQHSKDLNVDSDQLFTEVIPLIYDGMNTTELDELIAFKAADKVISHPDYSTLGGRLLLSRQSKLIGKEIIIDRKQMSGLPFYSIMIILKQTALMIIRLK